MLPLSCAVRFALLGLLAASSVACGQIEPSDGSSGPLPPSQPQPGPTNIPCALPASPTVTTLASGIALQSALATNTTSVFWSEGIGGATVKSAPKAGGAAVVIPGAKGQVAAADDDAVYVITGAGNASDFGIVRLPLDGGGPTTILANSTSITALAIDDARVYWSVSGSSGDCFGSSCATPTPVMSSAPKTGGDATTLAAFAVSYMRASGDLLYFANQVASDTPAPNTSIGAIPKAGGTPFAIASRPGVALSAFELDDTSIYWSESDLTDTVPPALMAIPKGGGTPRTVATIASHDPQKLALDVANIYWLDDNTQALMAAPKAGGTPAVVIGDQVTSSKFGGFGALAADAAGLFWVADVACGATCTGKVLSLGASCTKAP